ncbi:tetratricopeptide repeat protein [Pendulispora rubella]|uniref:Tetratricopeptide repeat protein n=1 Tax=Pendulispora rubella TaxID=2741070 RepID=A0ABZ2L9R1_9BACT
MRLRGYGLLCALSMALLGSSPASGAKPGVGSRPARPPHGPRSARDNVVRLATMLDDERTLAELKREGALNPRASEKTLLDAMRSYEALGDPEGAVDILRRRSARFPEETMPRVQLALLFERMGKSENAIPVWQALDEKFGLTTEQTVQYARVLSRLGRLEESLAVLKKHRPNPKEPPPTPPPPNPASHEPWIPPAQAYWRDIATLAWQFDDSAEALDAYRRVWAADHRAPDASFRLMTLAAEVGAREEATAVALEGYKAEKNPRYLLFIAEQCERVEDWICVARILNVPMSEQALFEGREQFWLLRAEAYDHLGNKNAARDAYRAALRLNPGSVPIRLALLWDAIDRKETQTLSDYINAWKDDVNGEPEMWSPYAIALVRLGRVREAIPFFQRRIRAQPGEYVTMLGYADALDLIHRGDMAQRLRHHAFAKLREGLVVRLQDPKRLPPDEFHQLETHAELTRNLVGVQEGERWFSYAMNHSKPSEYREDFALGWYLGNDKPDYVKKRLASPESLRYERPIWDSYRLSLASTEDDRTEMARILGRSQTLGYAEKYKAELEIGRDDLAQATIQEQLVREEPIVDEIELRTAQRDIFERHAPIGRVGGTYEYVDGLHVAGPDILAGHDVGRDWRLLYDGFAREMTSPNQSVTIPGDGRRYEADLGVTLRFQQRDSIFELGAGANYQPNNGGSKATAVPHLELYHARDFLRDRVSAVFSAKLNTQIDDTPFMRLAAVRDEVNVIGHLGITQHLYMVGDVLARENTSRTFEHLGSEVGGSADLGVHILRRTPELNIAFRASVYHRVNVSTIPGDLQEVIPVGTAKDVEAYLAPSYRMLSGVVQLTRGDFFERQRAERLPLPRYDCAAEFGYLFPQNAPAGGLRCSGSVRVSSHGYVSLLGSYTLGLFGIEDSTMFRTSLAYSQFFN